MNNKKIIFLLITIITIFILYCNNSNSSSSSSATQSESKDNSISDTISTDFSSNSEQESDVSTNQENTNLQENSPETGTMYTCSACNGSGMIMWYDGSVQLCPTCSGKGYIEVQEVMSEVNTPMNNVTTSYSDGSSRSRAEIVREINKYTEMLNDNKATLERLQENNESVTLWPSYQRMISQCEEKLYNLNLEYNTASR